MSRAAGWDGAAPLRWTAVAEDPAAVAREPPGYARAGATWWIETAKPEHGWLDGLNARLTRGV